MTANEMPAAEVDIGAPLVRALLADQHPDLSALPLAELTYGWDNAIYRLGSDLLVRLPRRAVAAELVAHEQRWLPELAPRLPLPIPAPVRIGVPGLGFPWGWSVCPWFEGSVAALAPPADPEAAAIALGEFLAALHQPAPPDAPTNPFRGIPLGDRAERLDQSVRLLGSSIDGPAVLETFADLVTAQPWHRPPVWLHGDLHPANLVTHEGRLAAVVDFGDITSGDPATDLAVAWMLLPVTAHREFRAAAGYVDDDTWARARGWALALSIAYVANSADNPMMDAIGQRTLAAAL